MGSTRSITSCEHANLSSLPPLDGRFWAAACCTRNAGAATLIHRIAALGVVRTASDSLVVSGVYISPKTPGSHRLFDSQLYHFGIHGGDARRITDMANKGAETFYRSIGIRPLYSFSSAQNYPALSSERPGFILVYATAEAQSRG